MKIKWILLPAAALAAFAIAEEATCESVGKLIAAKIEALKSNDFDARQTVANNLKEQALQSESKRIWIDVLEELAGKEKDPDLKQQLLFIRPLITQKGRSIIETGYMENGKWIGHGPYSETNDDVITTEGAHRHGLMEGEWITRYRSGQLMGIEHYHARKPHGVQKTWYPNGKLRSKSEYSNNKLDGAQSYWDNQGLLVQKNTYTNDLKEGEEILMTKQGVEYKGYYRSGKSINGYCLYEVETKLGHYVDGSLAEERQDIHKEIFNDLRFDLKQK